MNKLDFEKLLNDEINLRLYLWQELQKALVDLIKELDAEIDREFLEGIGTSKPIGIIGKGQ